MKPESNAWQQLQDRAAGQLGTGFAADVLRAARGPSAAAWCQLEAQASDQLRPGFADRVLRAMRSALPREIPSVFSQLALSVATVAVCMATVVYMHDRATRLEEQRSLADWSRFAAETQYLDTGP